MLWRASDNMVWTDSDNDLDMSDESPMTTYKVDHDIGYFGHDNPATAVRESVPFTVQPMTEPDPVTGFFFVNVGIVAGAHGSHVAGITAGNRLFGGQMSGAAPGAKIVSVRVCLFVAGCTSHALIEGMIYAVETADVDVVNMSIGGLPALNDGNNTRAVLYNRLIEDNNTQMFFSAGNSGPGTNTIGDPSVVTKAMAVGAYVTKETWQRNYGSDANFVDNLHPFSSRGPAEDGAFKPQIVAPGAAISSVPTWQVGQPVAGTYTLPPGYGMFNGTSMAAPQATGAAALLLSAAKARGVSHTAAQLRMAFNSTSRFIPGYNASDQGNGLIDVGRAWDLLQDEPQPVNITSKVAVHTILSDFLADPGFGPGIHDREGVTLGQSYTRTYTFTRTSGPNRPVLYHLRWVGNDGTFDTQNNLQLRLNVPTTLNVRINPSSTGIHSAILRLDNSSTDGIDYATMNTVIVPDELTAANGFSVTKTGMAGRNHVQRFFFRVPAGSPVLKVDMTGPDETPGTGQVRFLRFHPWGLGVDSNASTSCYMPVVAGCSTGSPLSRTWPDSAEGVWEVTVEARRTSDAAWAPFTLTASLFGVDVDPDPDIIPEAQVGVPVPRSYTLTNNFGSFVGRATGIRSRQRTPRRVHDREPRAAALHDDDPGRHDVLPGDDRQPVGSGGRSRPLRVPLQRPELHDAHGSRPVGGRRLRGVGHADEPDRGDVPGRRRRVRGPGGFDDVRLRRRLREPGAGLRLGHRLRRSAQPGLDLDRARLGPRVPGARGRSRDARERPSGHGRRCAGGLRGRGRRARHSVTPRTQATRAALGRPLSFSVRAGRQALRRREQLHDHEASGRSAGEHPAALAAAAARDRDHEVAVAVRLRAHRSLPGCHAHVLVRAEVLTANLDRRGVHDPERGLGGLRPRSAEDGEAEDERDAGHARADEQESTHGAASMTDPFRRRID